MLFLDDSGTFQPNAKYILCFIHMNDFQNKLCYFYLGMLNYIFNKFSFTSLINLFIYTYTICIYIFSKKDDYFFLIYRNKQIFLLYDIV